MATALEHQREGLLCGEENLSTPAFRGEEGVQFLKPPDPVQPAEQEAAVFRPKRGHGGVRDHLRKADLGEPQEHMRGDVGVCGDAIPENRVSVLYEVQVAQALRMARVGVP